MKISREDVLHITALARIGTTEEDIAQFQKQLSDIIESFDTLKQMDTEGVPPTVQVSAIYNVPQDDCVRPSLSPGKVLENAPRRKGDFFRIHAVMEDD